MSLEEKEKKNKQAGLLISGGIHVAVILLFIFLVAWRAPDPPLPEFGIELNFGTSNQGTGDIQPETTPSEAETVEEVLPDTPEEVVEKTVEETVPVEPEITDNTSEMVEEVTTEVQEEIVPVTDQETPAPVKEVEKKPVEKKPVVEKEKKEEPKPQPPKILYPGKKDGAAGNTGDSKNPAAANQGDKTGAVGDQGDKEGNVDARSLYGKSGGGGGSSLEMAGWMWDSEPNPDDNTSESGKIVFDIKIDERGELISVTASSYTVSASLVKKYREAVERLTFTKTSGKAQSTTEGKITFTIKAK